MITLLRLPSMMPFLLACLATTGSPVYAQTLALESLLELSLSELINLTVTSQKLEQKSQSIGLAHPDGRAHGELDAEKWRCSG